MNLKLPLILIAEDDQDDRMIIQDALEETHKDLEIKFVYDGQQLIEYLESNDDTIKNELPSVIILDLNMPKIDGREALKFVKSHTIFKKIPTIVLTTSQAAEDIEQTYDMGVNSFITKPNNYSEMIVMAEQLSNYWFKAVQLP